MLTPSYSATRHSTCSATPSPPCQWPFSTLQRRFASSAGRQTPPGFNSSSALMTPRVTAAELTSLMNRSVVERLVGTESGPVLLPHTVWGRQCKLLHTAEDEKRAGMDAVSHLRRNVCLPQNDCWKSIFHGIRRGGSLIGSNSTRQITAQTLNSSHCGIFLPASNEPWLAISVLGTGVPMGD